MLRFCVVCQPRFTNIQYNLAHELGIWEKQSSFLFQAKTCQTLVLGNMYATRWLLALCCHCCVVWSVGVKWLGVMAWWLTQVDDCIDAEGVIVVCGATVAVLLMCVPC